MARDFSGEGRSKAKACPKLLSLKHPKALETAEKFNLCFLVPTKRGEYRKIRLAIFHRRGSMI